MLGKSRGLLSYDNLRGVLFSVETNTTLSEMYGLYTFVNTLPSDRFIHHENSSEFFVDNEYTDAIVRDMTFDSSTAVEKASVAVLNGTNIPGVAGFGARVVQNSSGHVISVENTKDTYHESMLIVESNDLAVLKEIQRFFDIENVVVKRLFTNPEPIADRADVTLIIGFDRASNL